MIPILTAIEAARERARPTRWRHSPALVTALLIGLIGSLIAIAAQRPDILVLASPMIIYALYAGWSRPTKRPAITARLGTRTVYEGQSTELSVELAETESQVGQLCVVAPPMPWLQTEPPAGLITATQGSATRAVLELASGRWGIHEVSPLTIGLSSNLGAWRLPLLETSGARLKTLPLRDDFKAVNSVPRPAGLVGLHSSRRPGDSGELAGVRPFQPGDRLRRINWRVSSRTQELHVNSTWSERDTEVHLLIDSRHDIGWSEGTAGDLSSSLDIAVRATAALAEHYLRHGDRVGVVDLGANGRDVAPGAGHRQLRLILDVLVASSADRSHPLRPPRVRSGSLVIALSPLLDGEAISHIVVAQQQGGAVIVIDTLLSGVGDLQQHTRSAADDPVLASLAWRLRLLEREHVMLSLRELGIPVVTWRGPGSLDEVLRDVSRMSAAPRLLR